MDVWTGTFEEDESQRRPIDDHVQKLLTFAHTHEATLKAIAGEVHTSVSGVEPHQRPVNISLQPRERVLAKDLVITENPVFRKVRQPRKISCP